VTTYFTTRIWTAKPGQGEQVRSPLAGYTRIVAGISGARVRVFQNRDQPERYVTLGEWPYSAAFAAFRNHPDIARVSPALTAALAEEYPAGKHIDMDEVTGMPHPG
jgi:heme-degrading monooxygenase HmoA